MYKSTLTQACVDYLESTGKTIDEDHAGGWIKYCAFVKSSLPKAVGMPMRTKLRKHWRICSSVY